MLDKLRVEVRLRTPWEAADLGFALLREHAGAAFGVFAILALPLALALTVALRSTPWLTPLILWWLKPLLDRPVLHVLARGTFGDAPGILGTLRQVPRLYRRGLVAQLLWRRPSLDRGLLLPVWQLEEPDGSTYRARRQVLLRRGRSHAQLLTVTCFLFQALAFPLVVALLAYFWPAGGTELLDAVFGGRGERIAWLDAFLWFVPTLAMVAIEPFYVAAGFGLYLNRRVQLEGWDLELAFRLLGERARKLAARGLGALVLAFLLLAPARLQGAPPPEEPKQTLKAPPPRKAKAELAEVLKAPEFATQRDSWHLELREPVKPENKTSTPWTPPRWLLALPKVLASALKWTIPVALIALVAFFVWRNRKLILSTLGEREPQEAPTQLFGLDIRPAALPRDIPTAALALWDDGDPRAALSLLYRGALAHLVHRLRAPLGPGATEGDCLDVAREALTSGAWDYFARLTRTWLGLAYGGRSAQAGDRDLCAEWGGHFQGRVS